ncbi:MAG: PhzF family phenazine biosynthesis protein [Steroidobacterales bacterium]
MRIFQVDAFTQTPFTGNPATVILDADGRDDATLMAIAREFQRTETAFVLAPTAADHDLRMRFFNARKEWPFIGHATIAAHAVLLEVGRRGFGRCLQHSGTGIIEVSAHAGTSLQPQRAGIEFRQSVPELEAPIPLKTTLRVAEALRLPARQLHESLPARLARKGSTRLLVPVEDAAALDAMAPNFDTLEGLSRELGAEGFFVFAYHRSGHEMLTDSRMFCPALGLPEDPVSGNAHAMLATYLWEFKLLDEHTTTFLGRQGRQLQRPGQVNVSLELDQGRLAAVRIGGGAVIVSAGELRI